MLPSNPAHKQDTLQTYFFVELELWHSLVDLIQTEVLEQQEAWQDRDKWSKHMLCFPLYCVKEISH